MTEQTHTGYIVHFKRRHDLYHDYEIGMFEYVIKHEDFRGDTYTEYVSSTRESQLRGYRSFLHRSEIFDEFAEAQAYATKQLKRDRDRAALIIHDIDKSLSYHSFMGAGI